MMSSCCTLRLKRRRAFSRDSLSWMMTSATFLIHPQSGSDWYLAAPLAGQPAAGCVLLRAPPLVVIIACINNRHFHELGPECSSTSPLRSPVLLTGFEPAALVFFPTTLVRMGRFSIRAAGAANVRYAGCHCSSPCRGPGRTPLAAHSR